MVSSTTVREQDTEESVVPEMPPEALTDTLPLPFAAWVTVAVCCRTLTQPMAS